MSDFILDLRRPGERIDAEEATSLLQFYPDIQIEFCDRPDFRLCLARYEPRDDIWAPYTCPETGVFVAVCGRVAFDHADWERARRRPGDGGLASKAVLDLYSEAGVESLARLNGNFTVHLYEPATCTLHMVGDRTGTHLAYGVRDGANLGLVLASHPDVLASVLGVSNRWDEISIAEFILTGKVSYPRTHYVDLEALPFGSVRSFSFSPERLPRVASHVHTSLEFNIDSRLSEEDHAEQLSEAFLRATERRTYAELGRATIALSGGLDSRVIISSAPADADLAAFCCFDEENYELMTARAIAAERGIELVGLRRPFDHYADHAKQAVRIAGGMGDIGSNHFLGFRKQIQDLGTASLITGCYCDYLFKSLAIDTMTNRLTRRETLAPFRIESYLAHFERSTRLGEAVRQREEDFLSPAMRRDMSEVGRLEIARCRTFPLQYEGDNVQRTTIQRSLCWYPPAVDSDVIDAYLRVPLEQRLNKSLFTKMVIRRCSEALCRIPDANTGARVGASKLVIGLNRYRIALRRAMERRRRSIVSDESWPNWTYYLRESERVQSLWKAPSSAADSFFRDLMGADFSDRISNHLAKEGSVRGSTLVLRLLTTRLWFEQRGQ